MFTFKAAHFWACELILINARLKFHFFFSFFIPQIVKLILFVFTYF